MRCPAVVCSVVTVNDYLARRDAEWMRPLYEGLGFERRVILSMQPQWGKARGLYGRHHLRYQQRIRF